MEQNGTRCRLYLRVLIGVVLALAGPSSHAAQGQQCKPAPSKPLTLTINKTRVVTLGQAVGKISVGTPNIANIPEIPKETEREAADFIIVGRDQILLVGKSPGTTNLIVWDESGCVVAIYDVEVTHDLPTLQAKLHELMPDEKNIRIHTSQNAIVLSGEVSNLARMDTALKLARTFAPKSQTRGPAVNNPGSDPGTSINVSPGNQGGGRQQGEDNVINMLQVGGVHQVMLEVKVAEVNRTVLKRLGINTNIFSPQGKYGFGAVKGGASFPNADFGGDALNGGIPLIGPNTGRDPPLNPIVGPLLDLYNPATPTISDAGLFIYSLSKNLLFSVVIDALKENGLAKLLAEPNLTTLSGQEAQFRSGGEFPIPVDSGNNAITVEFKEFGIAVNFLPVVLDSERISLRTNISVSDILQTQTANIGVPGTNTVFVVPSLAKRSAASTVELADGQSIAIAGLINDRVREASDKLPGLGEIPILGLLFSSEEFRKEQTELVIFVTPRLAQPTPPQQVRLPTEAFVEPSDMEFYLMGRLEGKPRPKLFDPRTQGGGMEGDFGHGL